MASVLDLRLWNKDGQGVVMVSSSFLSDASCTLRETVLFGLWRWPLRAPLICIEQLKLIWIWVVLITGKLASYLTSYLLPQNLICIYVFCEKCSTFSKAAKINVLVCVCWILGFIRSWPLVKSCLWQHLAANHRGSMLNKHSVTFFFP